jgi:hypothetical protein
VRASEITLRHIFLSPYRCRDCRARFWVISRNTYYFAGIIGVAIAVGAIGWNVGAWLVVPGGDPSQTKAAAQRLADLVKLAENNDAVAEYELARMHGDGLGVPMRAQEAYKWLERSARHGNVQAQYELGIALRDGRDTIQDHEAARKWIRLAAEGGHGQAQLVLGVMYRSGTGVPADNLKAYVWLNVAAAQGVPGAASARDTVLARLAPAELQEAQAEARRRSATYAPKPAPAQ